MYEYHNHIRNIDFNLELKENGRVLLNSGINGTWIKTEDNVKIGSTGTFVKHGDYYSYIVGTNINKCIKVRGN